MLLLRNLLEFTDGGMLYEALPFDAVFHQHAFGKATRVSNIMRSVPVPRSLADYKAGVTSASALVEKARGKAYAGSYGWMWVVRSYLLTEMRVAGIRELRVDATDTLSDLQVSFPDRNGWLSRILATRKTPSSITVKDLVRELNYNGPIEMLTCDLCIFGGKAARDFRVEDIDSKRQLLRNTCERLRRNADQQAHPLVVLRAALQPGK